MSEPTQEAEGSAAHRSFRSLDVTCTHCGSTYRIGEDAFLTTLLDVFAAMSPLDRPSDEEQVAWFVFEPHVVHYIETSDSGNMETVRATARIYVELIRRAHHQGLEPLWCCCNCEKTAAPRAYPA